MKQPHWYRGMAQHALFWLTASSFFLLNGLVAVSRRVPLSFALGLTCLAILMAARTMTAGSGQRRSKGRWAYVTASLLLLGLLSLQGAYSLSAGAVHAQAIEAILQTDLAEAYGYFSTRLLVLWTMLWAASAALFWRTLPRVPDRLSSRGWVQGLLLIGSAGLLAFGRGVITEPLEVVTSYRDGIKELREATAKGKANPLAPIASDFNGTVILVIGESTSRHHMALYGYPRNTTPFLSAIRPELAVFEDAIANESSTIDSVVDSLTLRSPANSNPASVGVLQLAKAAGFQTTWLSNQNEFGVWDNPVTILAHQADRVRFHDRTLGKLLTRKVFDEAMLPSLDQALASDRGPRRLIVVHLISTHLPYCWTKPGDFNPLGGEFGKRLYGQQDNLLSRMKLFLKRRTKDLNCYDNGVRYVDRMLGEIIARARRQPGPAAVLYFSDHGQAPMLATGHDSAEHSSYHLEIPFFLWSNRAYRDSRPGKWNAAHANRAKPYSISLMPATLIDLLELKTPLLRRQDSLLDPAFRPRARTAIAGSIRYDQQWTDNDYRTNSRVFVRKLGDSRGLVWAHRVNTLGKLLEAKRTFAGIEIDTYFDARTRKFQIRHEYADIGLTLDEMLEWSRDRPGMKIWLDWKNATPQNVDAALAELDALDLRFAIKRRMLVETDELAVSPALAAVSRAGFEHGYYLPLERIQAAMDEGDAAMDKLATELKQVILRGRFDAVTYDARLQPFVTAKLEQFLMQNKIRRYSWDLQIDAGDADTDPAAIAAMVRQRRLKALLVSFPSDFSI